MTIGKILSQRDKKVFGQLNAMRKINTVILTFKLDYEGLRKGIERRIDMMIKKNELERFITTELAYRQDAGDNSIVRKAGYSIGDAIRMRAPHLITH